MFERNWTFAIPNNGGPAAEVVATGLPGVDADFFIEGWIGNFGTSNVWVFEGALSVNECQARMEALVAGGPVDALLVLSGAGAVRRMMPSGVADITVFFEALNSSGQSQSASIKVCS